MNVILCSAEHHRSRTLQTAKMLLLTLFYKVFGQNKENLFAFCLGTTSIILLLFTNSAAFMIRFVFEIKIAHSLMKLTLPFVMGNLWDKTFNFYFHTNLLLKETHTFIFSD